MAMAEKEQSKRHEMEENSLNAQIEFTKKEFGERRLGQIFAFILAGMTIAGGVAAILDGHTVTGGLLSGGSVVALSAVFVYGRSRADKDSES